MTDLPRTPEGRLVRSVRESAIPKLTIRAAAARIGMSSEQWGYAERGYLPARDGKPSRDFRPPAPTLARMASSLGITPAELATAGERPDAAEKLQGILARKEAPRLSVVPGPGWLEGFPDGEEELRREALAAPPEVQEVIAGLLRSPDSHGGVRPWDERRPLIVTILRLSAGGGSKKNDREA